MSTSKLQECVARKLFGAFPHLSIKENYRPEWLQNPNGACLELDFYIKELSIAIEVQGKQHYEYTPYFHGSYNGFLDQLKRDEVKKDTCFVEGIKLYEVGSEFDIKILLSELTGLDNSFEKTNTPQLRNNFFENSLAEIDKFFCHQAKQVSKKLSRLNRLVNGIPELEKQVEEINYLLSSRRGMIEHTEYKKWLRQVRGKLKTKISYAKIKSKSIEKLTSSLETIEQSKQARIIQIPAMWEGYYYKHAARAKPTPPQG